jgi:tellurite methyltransferase
MPIEDADRWNSRYRDDIKIISNTPRSLLVDHSAILPTSGLALDIAMGLGDNSIYLMKRGMRVIGVDISLVALQKAKRKFPELLAVVADLNNFYIPICRFDVITCFLYLQRDLWLSMTQGLKIGGVMFIECLTEDMLTIHPKIDPKFLLKPGELQQAFLLNEIKSKVELIHYNEGWRSTEKSHPRAVASLIARRIV